MSEQGRARYALIVLFVVNAMNFFDRSIGGALGAAANSKLRIDPV